MLLLESIVSYYATADVRFLGISNSRLFLAESLNLAFIQGGG